MENIILNTEDLNPLIFHPGVFLLQKTAEHGLLKKDLARHLNILPNNLSQIFAGRRNVSVVMALKLEKVFEMSAEYWIGLQYAYELQEARKMES